MTIAGKILIGVDKFFNWISGGNPTNTISARTGYFSLRTTDNPFWKLMEAIINFAFWTIDGRDHCYQAYSKESVSNTPNDFQKGSKIMMALMAVFVILGCSIIAAILHLMKVLKKGR